MDADQAFTSGICLSHGQRVDCGCCGTELRPNDRVEVLVAIDDSTAGVVSTRERCCARGELAHGIERSCLLVRGMLAASVDPQGRSEVIVSRMVMIDRTA